jgi:UDP-glucuronate 4-epimerase
MMPMQPGDVLETSDTQPLYDLVGFKPRTSVKQGEELCGVV